MKKSESERKAKENKQKEKEIELDWTTVRCQSHGVRYRTDIDS